MKISCEINDDIDGRGITAQCSRCGTETEAYGTGDASVRRALVAMKEECPRGERNFYVSDDGRG